MEKRNVLNGRLSLSTSNLSGTPVAESTHITHTQQKFPWGDGGLNKSEKCIQNDSAKRINSFAKADLRHKNDPRIYADIQSKGITSRIVKYHGNTSKLSSSLSMNNLYNKPGHFPVVHLNKKKNISYNLNKKNLSMVRIAPPERSVFQANTRSSILRTGSIVSTIGFQKSGDEISCENRPILHPAVENEIAPTRSVLDDLKEISRKRINSDVLDSNDSLKKYCKELEILPVASPIIQQTSVPSSLYAFVPSKRQREIPISTIGTEKSPEQHGIKRRMYSNSNNDITSSLSSSLSILSPKQKCPSISTRTSDFQLATPTTVPVVSKLKLNNSSNFGHNVHLVSTENHENTLNGVPLRSISEPIFSTQNNNKPKLTLFNKNYETSVSKEHLQSLKNNTREECSDICFVKPKANTLATNNIGLSENSLIARTQKSKLALMLSGLSGDLNMNGEDDVDSTSELNKETENNSKPKTKTDDFGITLNTPQTALTFGTSTTVATKIISSPTTTTNLNLDKITEKSTLPQLNDNNSSTMNISNNIIGSTDATKSPVIAKHVFNKKEIENNSVTPMGSLIKFQNNYSTDNVSEALLVERTTSANTTIFASKSDNISSFPKTSITDQLTSSTTIGKANKSSFVTNVSETTDAYNINVSQYNLSQQKNIATQNTYTNSNDVQNNVFTNNPKTSLYFSKPSLDSNILNTNLSFKPTEPIKELNQIVSQNSFADNKPSATINLFSAAPVQNFFNIPENSKNDSFSLVNSKSKENLFTKFISNEGSPQNLMTTKPLETDIKNSMDNKIIPIQSSENQFLATSNNLNSSGGGFSFKPVKTATQQNENKNIFGPSNNIPNIFSLDANTKETLGSNVVKTFSFGDTGTNTPSSINKGFTFDEKKTITAPLNIEGSSTQFTFGNKLPIANQFSIGTINNTDTVKSSNSFSFTGNIPQNTNLTSNSTTGDKPFSFSSNANTQKEAAFNFYGKSVQNLYNNDVQKTEIAAKPAIPNLFNLGSSPIANDRLIRKATRRLHK